MNLDKYITREDYLLSKGIDLQIELQDDDNKSMKVKRFIQEVTDWCIEYLTTHYDCQELLTGEFEVLADFRKTRFRQGVIEQIEYLLDNGWLNKDSGLNRDLNTIIDLSKLELGRTAYQKFKLGAFCNIVRY